MSEDLDGGSSRVLDKIYLCLECWGYMINPSSAIGSTTFQQKGGQIMLIIVFDDW
jgi:hypothetical protein